VAGSLPAPQTEAELLTQLPPSNIPGVLPRELLPPGERVLFETRPSLFALYWGRLVFLGLYLALWIAFAATAPPDAVPGSLFFAFLGFIWLAYLYFQWRNRVYALTDQRVIRVSGIRGSSFQDAAYTQIHNLSTESGFSGGLQFDTTPPPDGSGFTRPSHTRPLRWDALSDAPRVYTFVQQAFAFGLRQHREAAVTQAAFDSFTSGALRCEYCGGLIDLNELDRSNPRCPRCRAPVTFPM
jgi:hypothetical protein